MHNKGVSALEEVNAYVFRAGELLKLSKDFIKAFSTSERELIISIPLRRESGGIDVLTGYRIQHSSARGPRKGAPNNPSGLPVTTAGENPFIL